ncbi:Multidrug resistance-associated protein 1, partial [Clydaea vesicula]
DEKVGRKIFKNVLSKDNLALLSNSTVVLVTNNISLIMEDTESQIIYMDKGEIVERGTYRELKELRGQAAIMFDISRDSMSNSNLDSTSSSESDETETILEEDVSEFKSATNEKKETEEKKKVQIEESRESGKVSRKILARYLKYWGKSGVILASVLLILHLGFLILPSLWLATISKNNQNSSFLMSFGLYAIFVLISGFMLALCFFILIGYLSIRPSTKISASTIKSVIFTKMSFFDKTPAAQIINRFSSDIKMVDSVIPTTLANVLISIMEFLQFLILTCIATQSLIFLVPLIGVIYYYLQKYFLKTSVPLSRLAQISKSDLYQNFNEGVSGSTVIRAFQAEEFYKKKFKKNLDYNNIFLILNNVSFFWMVFHSSLLASVFLIAIVTTIILIPTTDSAFAALAFVSVSGITDGIRDILNHSSEFENTIVSVERLLEYTDLKAEEKLKVDDTKLLSNWPMMGKIEFKNYSAKYDTSDLVLKDFNFTVNAGERLGIVGRTGAGKSSITMGLFRIINPASGSIVIDDVDISTITLQTLRSRMTIIPQEPFLFPSSLRSNIDQYSSKTDVDIWQVLEKVGMKEYVTSNMPDGLDTVIEDNGSSLSIGQRQLICLARAILKDDKILVFDEATASIDVITERSIQHVLNSELKNCTVLTIAHRLNTVMNSDRILVLDQGRVVQLDKPENLKKDLDGYFSV